MHLQEGSAIVQAVVGRLQAVKASGREQQKPAAGWRDKTLLALSIILYFRAGVSAQVCVCVHHVHPSLFNCILCR
jgi:hypothetical protein